MSHLFRFEGPDKAAEACLGVRLHADEFQPHLRRCIGIPHLQPRALPEAHAGVPPAGAMGAHALGRRVGPRPCAWLPHVTRLP